MRKPHQILAFPFILEIGEYYFGIFLRSGRKDTWQGIAGGVEDGKTYLDACKREGYEEAGITDFSNVIELESICTIPISNVTKEILWGDDNILIYEHCFGIECKTRKIVLSDEHSDFEWLKYEDTIKRLKWDSNKNALWKLHYRLINKKGEI